MGQGAAHSAAMGSAYFANITTLVQHQYIEHTISIKQCLQLQHVHR